MEDKRPSKYPQKPPDRGAVANHFAVFDVHTVRAGKKLSQRLSFRTLFHAARIEFLTLRQPTITSTATEWPESPSGLRPRKINDSRDRLLRRRSRAGLGAATRHHELVITDGEIRRHVELCFELAVGIRERGASEAT